MDNDLISREALKEHKFSIPLIGDYQQGWNDAIDAIYDNVPTALFPLTVTISDKITDKDIELIKRLMKDYKPQVLNLEMEAENDKQGSD